MDPDYSTRIDLAGGTWARLWMPSPADYRVIRQSAEAEGPALVAAADAIYAAISAACIECHGPRPGGPDDQPTPWVMDLLNGWLGTKDGGLPPASAAT